jgi:hypothetical protein
VGLNFHVRCRRHKVTGMIPRGHESEILHWFYKEHSECRQLNSFAVEVEADEESEQHWMNDESGIYQDITDQIYDQIEQLRERHKKRESDG